MNKLSLPLKTCARAIVLAGMALSATAGEFTFTGEGNRTLPEFTVDGPWTLNWTSRSDNPTLASIEIRLYDRGSDDYLGKVAERLGTGSGYKMFEKPGRYQIVVVGTSIDWEIMIEEIDPERAAAIKRQALGEASLEDTTRRYSKRLPQDSFEGWQPDGDDLLLLYADGYLRWRVTFSPADCKGLDDAAAISFVTPVGDPDGAYDSIMLDDGTRCYFDNVVPAYVR